jgi:hypothetical protein
MCVTVTCFQPYFIEMNVETVFATMLKNILNLKFRYYRSLVKKLKFLEIYFNATSIKNEVCFTFFILT